MEFVGFGQRLHPGGRIPQRLHWASRSERMVARASARDKGCEVRNKPARFFEFDDGTLALHEFLQADAAVRLRGGIKGFAWLENSPGRQPSA